MRLSPPSILVHRHHCSPGSREFASCPTDCHTESFNMWACQSGSFHLEVSSGFIHVVAQGGCSVYLSPLRGFPWGLGHRRKHTGLCEAAGHWSPWKEMGDAERGQTQSALRRVEQRRLWKSNKRHNALRPKEDKSYFNKISLHRIPLGSTSRP